MKLKLECIILNLDGINNRQHYVLEQLKPILKNSGMDKTSMFKNAYSAKLVAEDGYKAIVKGKLIIVSGLNFFQKLMMKTVQLMPKKLLLKQIRIA